MMNETRPIVRLEFAKPTGTFIEERTERKDEQAVCYYG